MLKRCAFCLQYFEEKELDELILTSELICKECLKQLMDKTAWMEDPEPWP